MKFYICPACGELVTEAKRNESTENGGLGMCMCDYTEYEWDGEACLLRLWFPRRYHDYIEISEGLYNDLALIVPDVSRLKAFIEVPVGHRLTYRGSE